jgi:hypothetical protein
VRDKLDKKLGKRSGTKVGGHSRPPPPRHYSNGTGIEDLPRCGPRDFEVFIACQKKVKRDFLNETAGLVPMFKKAKTPGELKNFKKEFWCNRAPLKMKLAATCIRPCRSDKPGYGGSGRDEVVAMCKKQMGDADNMIPGLSDKLVNLNDLKALHQCNNTKYCDDLIDAGLQVALAAYDVDNADDDYYTSDDAGSDDAGSDNTGNSGVVVVGAIGGILAGGLLAYVAMRRKSTNLNDNVVKRISTQGAIGKSIRANGKDMDLVAANPHFGV